MKPIEQVISDINSKLRILIENEGANSVSPEPLTDKHLMYYYAGFSGALLLAGYSSDDIKEINNLSTKVMLAEFRK